METGSQVVVIGNGVCRAPKEIIGQEGIVVAQEVNGITGRYAVLFAEPVLGYTEWLFDEVELEEGKLLPYNGSLMSYKV